MSQSRKSWFRAAAFATALMLWPLSLWAQAGPDVLTSTRESLAISYPEGSKVKVSFEGTMRLPGAEGEAEVERRLGTTQIQVKLKNMKPATLFGGHFSTYVLWTVSPEGIAVNAGEFILDGHKSELKVSTPLDMFGMFVTAEPHYLVKVPSRFVVLDNTDIQAVKGRTMTKPVKYQGFDGVYDYERESLVRAEATKGEFRVDRQQATMAVMLAKRAEAQKHASEELEKAEEALSKTLKAFSEGVSQDRISLLAHETVRLAVEAQDKAQQRKREEERRAKQQQIDELTKAKQEAEQAAAEARKEREEAMLAKAEAEQAAKKARDEQAQARELMQQARREAEKLARLKAQAESNAERARSEAEEARARMENALSRVVETKETARGMIVNLPDILFDTGEATLRPKAREILSRVAGILLVAPEYQLSVEGHTDSVGSEDFNQRLSERRAQAVRDYLIEAQLSPDLITTQGFGESQPVASNDTREGRQQNRRVEIVIHDLEMTSLEEPESTATASQ